MNLHDRDIRKKALEEGITLGISQGISRGIQQKAEEAGIELLKEAIAPEIVSKCVKLPLEKVLDLQKSILAETLYTLSCFKDYKSGYYF